MMSVVVFFFLCLFFLFFFFSSRRRHTRLVRDWSSDVCSSDLRLQGQRELVAVTRLGPALALLHEMIEQLPAMMLHDVHLVVRVLERVRGEVVAARERVGADRVLVGGVLQFGIGHAAQDFLQLLRFFDNGVAVLDEIRRASCRERV